MMHHPINWLVESECNEVEKELAKFDIVLNGHVHVYMIYVPEVIIGI